jgi:hypothetical protein
MPGLRRLLGHRGTFLLTFGVIYVTIGAGIRAVNPSPIQHEGLQYVIAAAGGYHRLGWIWILCGLVAAGYAFTPQVVDRWGFYALMLPSIAWASSYLAAGMLGAHQVLILATLVYSALSVAVGSAAAWPEPPALTARERP